MVPQIDLQKEVFNLKDYRVPQSLLLPKMC